MYPHYSDLDCSCKSVWPQAQTLYGGYHMYRYWLEKQGKWSKWYYIGVDEIPLPWNQEN